MSCSAPLPTPSSSSTSTATTSPSDWDDGDDGPELVKGFVYKLSRTRFPHGGLRKRRMVVMDRRLGKVFVMKLELGSAEPEVLDQIDVSSASFTMDHGDSGFFSVHVGSCSHEFDAVTHEQRVVWLKHLQRTRAAGIRLRNTSVGITKKSPILKSVDIESLPWIDDPFADDANGWLAPSSSSSSAASVLAAKKRLEPELASLQDFGKRVARTIGLNSDENRVQFADGKDDANQASAFVGESPPVSPVQRRPGFRNLSRRVKSFRLAVDNLPAKSFASLTECRHCPKLTGRLRSVEEDLSAREVENSALRQSLEILRDQCDVLVVEKANFSGAFDGEALDLLKGSHILQILREKDARILEAEQRLERVDELRREAAALRARIETYEELVRVKDEAIVCLANGCPPPATEVALKPASESRAAQTDMSAEEVGELMRMLTAANSRADFMNEEVVECGKLLHEASRREERALGAAREWEAKFYQTQSKYLSLLNDIHAPPEPSTGAAGSSGDYPHKSRPDVISRLVRDVIDSQDARAMEARSVPPGGVRSGLYDELGFVHQSLDYAGHPGTATVESKLLAIRDRAEDMKFEMAEKESPEWRSAWDAFLLSQDVSDGTNKYCPDLKGLLRRGVPLRDRGRVWTSVVKSRVPEDGLVSDAGVRYYHGLLTELWSRNKIDPVIKQIELDLPRTLPNNRHYESSRADGIPRLRRVLIAFSLHRPDVGYCQGLNRIAAVALLFMSEEDAFWTLSVIVDRLMPAEYYSRTLTGAQIDQVSPHASEDLLIALGTNMEARLQSRTLDIEDAWVQ